MSTNIIPALTDKYLPLFISRKSILHQLPDTIEWKDISDKTYEIDREISHFKSTLSIEDRFIIAAMNAHLTILLKLKQDIKTIEDLWWECQAFETFIRRYLELEVKEIHTIQDGDS